MSAPTPTSAPVDLGNPDVEPTDEELAGLWARACAAARATHAASLTRLRVEIASERRAVLAALTPASAGGARVSAAREREGE